MIALAMASALVASVNLSISSPEEYFFVDPVETNLLTGVGMGAVAPTNDAPLSYSDAAFLAEAYMERHYSGGTNGYNYAKSDARNQISARLTLATPVYYRKTDCKAGHGKWLADFKIPSDLAVATTDGILSAVAGTNAVYVTFSTNDTNSATKSGLPPNASAVATLYEDVAKMRRIYSVASVQPQGSKGDGGDYYTWTETLKDYSGLIGSDGNPTGNVPETTTNVNYYAGSSAYDYEYVYSEYGTYDKSNFRTVNDDGQSLSADHYSHGGTWTFSKSVCPGVYLFADSLQHLLSEPNAWEKVKGARFFGRGTFSQVTSLSTTTAASKGATVTKSSTNGTFVIEIPLADGCTARGVAEADAGMGDYDDDIKAKVINLFGGLGISSLEDLKGATPEPESTPSAPDDYDHGTATSLTFRRDVTIKEFGVVVELEFAARVKGDDE